MINFEKKTTISFIFSNIGKSKKYFKYKNDIPSESYGKKYYKLKWFSIRSELFCWCNINNFLQNKSILFNKFIYSRLLSTIHQVVGYSPQSFGTKPQFPPKQPKTTPPQTRRMLQIKASSHWPVLSISIKPHLNNFSSKFAIKIF